MPIDLARHAEGVRVILAHGVVVGRSPSSDGRTSATLIVIDAPKDMALPGGTRELVSPVPVAKLIGEVVAAIGAKVAS
jgi:hypothetical protein